MNESSLGCIALVTGAAGCVGEAISIGLAECGYQVIMTDIDLQKLGQGSHKTRKSSIFKMDVRNPSNVENVIHEILTLHGPIDVLVNNAGILATGSIAEASYADWNAICSTNLSSVFYCSKAVMPSMLKRRKGRIINISSTSAVKGGGTLGNALYGTTKAGVEALTKGFARELGPHGITVNAIAPGLLETSMTFRHLIPSVKNNAISSIPAGRLGLPKDVTDAVLFLASEQASYINGTTVTVDGGGIIT